MAERIATPEDVKYCYRLLLGREPESYQIVLDWTDRNLSQISLIKEFINTEEFQTRSRGAIRIQSE